MIAFNYNIPKVEEFPAKNGIIGINTVPMK